MDWTQVFTIIGMIGGLTFWIDMRHREDQKDIKETIKEWRKEHADQIKECNANWLLLFDKMDNKIESLKGK